MFNPLKYLEIHHYLILFLLVICIIAFHKRVAIKLKYIALKERLHDRQSNYLPLNSDDLSSSSSSSWISDIGRGLTSKTFDLISDNLRKGDQREGLDEDAKNEVLKIMHEQSISFDEARLLYTRNKMNENNISEDGIPKDPKFVSFL